MIILLIQSYKVSCRCLLALPTFILFSAKKFGCTEFINPKELSRSVPEELIDRLDGGADYTFECVGNVKTMV